MRFILFLLAVLLLSSNGSAQRPSAYELSILDSRYGFSEDGISGAVIIVNSLPADRVTGEALTKQTEFGGDTTGTWNNLVESDPIWNNDKPSYLTSNQADSTFYPRSNPFGFIPSGEVYQVFYLGSNPSNYVNATYVTNAIYVFITNGFPELSSVTNRSTLETNVQYFFYGRYVSNQYL